MPGTQKASRKERAHSFIFPLTPTPQFEEQKLSLSLLSSKSPRQKAL